MDGVPWLIDELPRGQHVNPINDTLRPPASRKPVRKSNKAAVDVKLDTINERPTLPLAPKSPENVRRDASTSTTDLDGLVGSGANKEDADGSNKKVQKGQINALAKMLSALRR